ncbi:MAG: ubiquinone/menaquinone biosynthesis methyltransferase [Verrucomicrobiia bacterium]
MPNKFLSHDQQRAPKVEQLFTQLAPRYDLVNDIQSLGLHRLWKRRVVRLALDGVPNEPGNVAPASLPATLGNQTAGKDAGATTNARVLDLCCGTGDMTFEARRQGAALAVGVDFAQAMLDVAQRRRDAAGTKAFFARGDALRLPFADASFDAVTIGYGLRNVADIEQCLREMIRVLRPGGRLVILDFGKPANRLVRALYAGYLRAVLPVMGWLFHRDMQTYLYIIESLRTFPAQRGIEEMMRRAGMANVRVFEPLMGTMGINYGERTT